MAPPMPPLDGACEFCLGSDSTNMARLWRCGGGEVFRVSERLSMALPSLVYFNCIYSVRGIYPDLEADDLKAACAFGARLSQIKRIEPLAA